MSARKELVEARMRKGWSQEDLAAKMEVRRSTVSEWERGVKAPYPTHVQRLCEIFGMTPEELGIARHDTTSTLIVQEGSIEDIIAQCTVGIDTCRTLGAEGGHDGIITATQILGTYIPMLKTLLPAHQHHRIAALLSRIYQIKQGNAYHLETTSQSLLYAQEAVRYARLSENNMDLVIALHELASVYEWPLPGLQVRQRHKLALQTIDEAVHIQEGRHAQIVSIPHQVRAWIYIGQAKFRALSGLKQEAYTSIGKANEVRQSGEFAGLYFNTANLMRQAAIAHSYLGEQPKAVASFLATLDINDEKVRPAMPMPDRFHVSLLSETAYSSLRLPQHKKDKDLSIKLWKASLAKAIELRSTTYYNEAQHLLYTMECIWPDDAEISDLRDLLVPWE
jgi:transcriptional regulator with XRE-family HTH domain/tetratricopeptide (TPR) repeat protein